MELRLIVDRQGQHRNYFECPRFPTNYYFITYHNFLKYLTKQSEILFDEVNKKKKTRQKNSINSTVDFPSVDIIDLDFCLHLTVLSKIEIVVN